MQSCSNQDPEKQCPMEINPNIGRSDTSNIVPLQSRLEGLRIITRFDVSPTLDYTTDVSPCQLNFHPINHGSYTLSDVNGDQSDLNTSDDAKLKAYRPFAKYQTDYRNYDAYHPSELLRRQDPESPLGGGRWIWPSRQFRTRSLEDGYNHEVSRLSSIKEEIFRPSAAFHSHYAMISRSDSVDSTNSDQIGQTDED
ncbi:uncharacterized protein K460DRAFT_364157 [Cucurbitaria berberidis CBS 394.84]|uniref:Uncharacterized protein n=1 Tax=Cucurbitaria berberidis CBS 394.84 TaxID=1168544 RepID=A0A9P4GMJ2_9PLEO|nr:uncharacterized protein K460DRAFT_364157 [Cucurbitaria berberidis CBS 394.84]KAF1848189.1 hypothetical protein K460DRAFT_364157 [Cucurbitaria berberidis CBS 394.84]